MANCQHVKTQAHLDELLAARDRGSEVCIHVDADAEASALEWQRGQQEQVEINGDWGNQQ